MQTSEQLRGIRRYIPILNWLPRYKPEWLTYPAALALIAGAIYILLGLLRMGWIANFLSTPVLEGFIFGFGFGLIVDQSHKILGVPKVEGSYFIVLVGLLLLLLLPTAKRLDGGGQALSATGAVI